MVCMFSILKLEWNSIVSNSVTLLVGSVFLGAALQLWRGVETIDSRIDANLVDIRATQEVLAPKVDKIESRLAEILPLIIPDDKFPESNKRTKELIDERRIHNQIQQQGLRP